MLILAVGYGWRRADGDGDAFVLCLSKFKGSGASRRNCFGSTGGVLTMHLLKNRFASAILKRNSYGRFFKLLRAHGDHSPPSGVTLIETVFLQCMALHTVYFNAANAQCASFVTPSNMVIGEAVEYIPARLCYGNTKLKSVVFLGEPERIGSAAFACCTALERVELPMSLTEIGSMAFWKTALTELTVPKGVREMWGLASVCTSLRYLRVLGSPDVGNYAYASYCPMLEYIILGEGVKSLPEQSIYQCNALKGIVSMKIA